MSFHPESSLLSSFNIPYSKQITNNTKPLSLFKVDNTGIYNLNNNIRLSSYTFGEGSKVINIRNNLLIINFSDGRMFKYNKKSNYITKCEYPCNYVFHSYRPPTVNETLDGNMITIGGYNNNNVRSKVVNIYNIDNDTWSSSTFLPEGVSSHATVIVNGDIYVIGGAHNNSVTNKVIRYRDDVWESLAPLLDTRYGHVALLRNNYIYVYGGYGRNTYEYYDIVYNVWTSIADNSFSGVTISNSICDKYVIYMYSNNNIYSICLGNTTKTILYTNIKLSRNCLVLMCM